MKDLDGLNVPGPGVTSFLSSHMSSSSMIIIHGLLEEVDTL